MFRSLVILKNIKIKHYLLLVKSMCFFKNAGIEGVIKPNAEYPESAFDKVIAVNLKGKYLFH